MDYREQLQPGVGFLHLQRTLQPGERIPAMPSLIAQLSALQASMTSETEGVPEVEAESVEREDEEIEA